MRVAARYTIATLAMIHTSPTVLSSRSFQPRVVPSTLTHQSVWLMASKAIAPRYTLSNATVPEVGGRSRRRASSPNSALKPSPSRTQSRPHSVAPAITATVYAARNQASSRGDGG